jgi:hypothetical protein
VRNATTTEGSGHALDSCARASALERDRLHLPVWLMTGTAVAATQLAKNSVGAAQLKKGAVTNAKLANGAVTAAKVKKGSLTGTQIKASTLGLVSQASHAADADSLGGVPAAGYQARVSGACGARMAVQKVNADGSVLCIPSADPVVEQARVTGSCVGGIDAIAADGTTTCGDGGVTRIVILALLGSASFQDVMIDGFSSGLTITLVCHQSGVSEVEFSNQGQGTALLHWFAYSGLDTTSGSVLSGSNALDSGTGNQPFIITGVRLDGQFMFESDTNITTVNLHAVDGLECGVRGTAVVAPATPQ